MRYHGPKWMMCVSSEPAISREFVNKFADGNLLRDLQFECRGASKFSVAAIWLQQWACPFPSPTVSGECCKLHSLGSAVSSRAGSSRARPPNDSLCHRWDLNWYCTQMSKSSMRITDRPNLVKSWVSYTITGYPLAKAWVIGTPSHPQDRRLRKLHI